MGAKKRASIKKMVKKKVIKKSPVKKVVKKKTTGWGRGYARRS